MGQDHDRSAPVRELDSDVLVISRRSFFGTLLGVAGLAVSAVLTMPLLGSLLRPLYSKSSLTKWSKVGIIDSFPPYKSGPVLKQITFRKLDGWRQTSTTESVYVERKPDGKIRVLSAICPHLNCNVKWHASKNKFVCPCHGSVFGEQGKLLKGPARRGMDPLPFKEEDGELRVHFEFFREDVPYRKVIG